MDQPHDTPPAPAPRRILVADDVGDSRALLLRLLRQFTSAELHEARDGHQALERFRSLQPQITLLDIEMPLLDGMAVLQQIRNESGTSSFVAMVSANSHVETVRAAVALAAGGFVVKPYSPQRVLDMLRGYVARTGDKEMFRS